MVTFFISIICYLVITLSFLSDFYAVYACPKSWNLLIPMSAYCYLWVIHAIIGTSMTIVKFKDICYLQWWLLVTGIYILLSFTILLCAYYHPVVLPQSMKDVVRNLFGLAYLILGWFTVAAYLRTVVTNVEIETLE